MLKVGDAVESDLYKSEVAGLPPDAGVSQKLWRRVWSFARAVQRDSDFYIRTQAVKGGATAMALAGIGASTIFVLQLPVVLVAAGAAVCAGVAAVGLYGAALGLKSTGSIVARSWRKYILNDTTERPPKPPSKSFFTRIIEQPFLHKRLNSPRMKKIYNSRVGRTTRALTHDPQNLFMNGLAIQGSVVWGMLSLGALVTGILVFPVVALSGILAVSTWAAVAVVATAAAGVAGNAYGLFTGLKRMQKYMQTSRDAFKTNKPVMTTVQQPVVFLQNKKAALSAAFAKWSGHARELPQTAQQMISRGPQLQKAF